MSILGLDVGEKRIGVAISDPQGLLAHPLTVVQREGNAAELEAITSLVQGHKVERIVVGLPQSLDGSLGWEAERVQAFSEMLSRKLGIPVESWDERLSTVAAERLLREGGVRRDRRKSRRDAIAASFILQGYLDLLRNQTAHSP
jgi:putative Holliday junction resolvase